MKIGVAASRSDACQAVAPWFPRCRFVGVTEHLDLREAAKKRVGSQFDLKKYNDQVISYGSPPVKYTRELMGL